MLNEEIEKIIKIHDKIIEDSGREEIEKICVNRRALEEIVYKADRECDPIKQSAILLENIAKERPFYNGNKRLAWICAENSLAQYNLRLTADEKDVKSLLKTIQSGDISSKGVLKCIKRHTKKKKGF